MGTFVLPLLAWFALSALILLLPLAFLAMPAREVGEAVLKILRAVLG